MNRLKPAGRKQLFWATLQIAVALGIYAYVSFSAPQIPGQATAQGESAASSGRSPGKAKRTGHGLATARAAGDLAKSPGRDSAPLGEGYPSAAAGTPSDPNGTSLLTEVEGLLPDNRPASRGWLSSPVQDLAKGWSAAAAREKIARIAADVGNAVWDLTKRAASLLRTRAIEMWAAARKSPGMPETKPVENTGVTPVPGTQTTAAQAPATQAAPAPPTERRLATGRAAAGRADPGPGLPLGGQSERFF
jgi:hypothetical protein